MEKKSIKINIQVLISKIFTDRMLLLTFMGPLESNHVWEAEAGGSRGQDYQDHPGQHYETPSPLKIQKKISWVWWRAPLVPATWEAEARESLESRRRRLQ